MVGEHEYLAKRAASILSAKDGHFEDRIILFLVPSQLIETTKVGGERFIQVEHGSGIFRLVKSATQCFQLSWQETTFRSRTSNATHQTLFFRCRNDIFMIAEGGNGNLGALAKTLDVHFNPEHVSVLDRR